MKSVRLMADGEWLELRAWWEGGFTPYPVRFHVSGDRPMWRKVWALRWALLVSLFATFLPVLPKGAK